MHDAIQLERLGVPSTVIITEPFSGLVAQFAATLGMPEYPVIALPHPVSSRDDDTLRLLATQVAADVARLLGVAP